jgi:amino acid transporter
MILIAMAGRSFKSVVEQRHDDLVAGCVFLAVTLLMVVSVTRPAWRSQWRWGRRRRLPMSAFGRAAWIICGALWSLILFAEGVGFDAGWGFLILMLGLGLVFAAGIYDIWYWKHRDKLDN